MENRSETRHYLHRYPHALEKGSGELIGYLGDISQNGMMLICYQPITPGQHLDLEIKLPRHKKFSKTHLPATLEVRWTRPYLQPDMYCVGCFLLEMSEEDFEVIQEAALSLGFEPGFKVNRMPDEVETR